MAEVFMQGVATKDEFDNILKNNEKVVVEFYAEWCGPCQVIAPKIERLAGKYSDDIFFCRIDVDRNSETADANGVRAMPTFHFFFDGKKVDEFEGASEYEVEAKIVILQNMYSNIEAKDVDSSEDVQVIEVEEVVDGYVRKVRRTIRTKVVEVEEELVDDTEVEAIEAAPEIEASVPVSVPESVVSEDEFESLPSPEPESEFEEYEPESKPNVGTIITETGIVFEPTDRASFSNQLICQCVTPSGDKTFCLVTDNDDGTYTVDINASEPGVHTVDVELEGRKIPGSPFLVRIVQAVDKKKVLLYGAGLNSGLLEDCDSTIYVDTKGAGPGDLKVRVHGPKGGFTVFMDHDTRDSRCVNINYHPSIPGIYTLNVYWSGEHVTGSPSEIYLAPNVELLNDWFSNPEKIREMEGLTEKYETHY